MPTVAPFARLEERIDIFFDADYTIVAADPALARQFRDHVAAAVVADNVFTMPRMVISRVVLAEGSIVASVFLDGDVLASFYSRDPAAQVVQVEAAVRRLAVPAAVVFDLSPNPDNVDPALVFTSTTAVMVARTDAPTANPSADPTATPTPSEPTAAPTTSPTTLADAEQDRASDTSTPDGDSGPKTLTVIIVTVSIVGAIAVAAGVVVARHRRSQSERSKLKQRPSWAHAGGHAAPGFRPAADQTSSGRSQWHDNPAFVTMAGLPTDDVC